MIILHKYPPFFGLPNACPTCMKLEAYLRMADIPHQTSHIVCDLSKVPRKQIPYITIEGTNYSDSQLIIDLLKEKYGDPLGQGLTPKERAHHAGLRHMLEDHLYFITLAERWVEPANLAALKKSILSQVSSIIKQLTFTIVQKRQVNRLAGHGMGKFSTEERHKLGKTVFDHLSALLDDQPYFGGDKPLEIDSVTLSFIASNLIEEFKSPIFDHLRSKTNLMDYHQRMMEEVFPDY